MDKYIFDEKMVYGMSCGEIIIFLALLNQPKKHKSIGLRGLRHKRYLQEYKRRFTPRYLQAKN